MLTLILSSSLMVNSYFPNPKMMSPNRMSGNRNQRSIFMIHALKINPIVTCCNNNGQYYCPS